MLRGFLRDVFSARKAPVEEDGLRVAGELYDGGQYDEALMLLAMVIEYKPDWVEALALSGMAKRAVGQLRESATDLARAASLDPDNASVYFEFALTLRALGDERGALEVWERGRWLQVERIMGKESYFSVLERIHGELQPRTYVEIGVFRGESLRLAKAPTQAIGVDPAPQLAAPAEPNHKVFSLTSDAFFAAHDLTAEFGGLPVDLAFIDGMHHFDFALRDFANIERHCHRDSVILIHDCYPLDRETARRDGSPPFWSGDIWRLMLLLQKYRPDLSVHTIGAPPTGLGLVRNVDPESRFLVENHNQLVEEFLALDYDILDSDKDGQLKLVPNEWAKICPLLHAAA